jgi:hypothetical protein
MVRFEDWLFHEDKKYVRKKRDPAPRKRYGRYIVVYRPRHHFSRETGYILEHRLVWEVCNRACLLPWAHVHHKNKNTWDNKIENLEAMMYYHHKELHTKMSLESIGKPHISKLRKELPALLEKMGI